MRLVRLTLAGFKSFADRTEFHFEDDITGIVGPNGCGKSNVVDAIKWVLGERSSKSLRGKEMIDVIFAGSAVRKPAGLASVTLTFENPLITGAPGASDGEPRGDAPGSDEPGAVQTRAAGPHPPESEDDLDDDTADSRVLDASVRGRRALPIDADVVEVERRLYRDGTSQYLINSRRARLKDIRDLFLDTGVGADAYSIIEQGKVDAMLLASPQERRVVFEEAAGVARYKQRRVEAVRKLERTDQNLTTTREQLDSTERRLRLVKGQAAKARRFNELDQEYKALRLALAFDHYDEIRQRLEGLTSRLADLEHHRAEAAATVMRFDAARQEGELARGEALDAQRALEQQRTAAAHAGETASQRRAMLDRTLAETRTRLEQDREQMGRAEARLVDLARDIDDKGQRIGICAEQLGSAEQVMQQAGEARARVLESLTEQQSALAKRRAAAAEIDRERTRLLASVHADERRLESLREQAGRAAAKSTALTAEQSQIEQAMDALKASTAGRRDRIGQTEGGVREIDAALATLSNDRAALASALGDLEQRLVRAESRRQTLQEMVDAREGLADAVKLVLDRKCAGQGFAGVVAPLADLLTADAQDAPAIEAALGADLQALVTAHAGAMPTPDEIAGLVGRVTFMPLRHRAEEHSAPRPGPEGDPRAPLISPNALDWPVPGPLHDDATDDLSAGHRSPLSSRPAAGLDDATLLLVGDRVLPLRPRVRPDAAAPQGGDAVASPGASDSPPGGLESPLNALLDHLLGDTYLVSDLETARLLSAGPLAGCRFVTRDGACLERDGRLSAGPLSASQAGGMIQRRAELANLERDIATLTEQVGRDRASLRFADEEAAAQAARRSALASTLATLQREQIGEQTRLERAVADHARLERDRLALEQESGQIQAHIQRIEADRAALSEKAQSMARLHDEQSQAADALDRELIALRRRHDEASEQLTAAKIEVGRLGEQLAAARREHHALQGAREDATRRQRDLASAIDHNQSRAAEQERGIAEAAQIAASARSQIEQLDADLVGVRGRVADADQAVRSLTERLGAARSRAATIERDWNALETSRREAEVRRETLEERTLEEIGLDLAFEYADYRAMMRDDPTHDHPAGADPSAGTTPPPEGLPAAPGDVNRLDSPDESAPVPSHAPHAHAATASIRIIPVPREEGQKRVDQLRQEIRSLGNVNLDAIDEEQTLAARNEDLIQQVADLDAAGRQLRELIDRLNDASRTRFQETFTRVQEEFGGKNGMYRRLFGGGKAEVRLMPLVKEIDGEKVETDQIDMLESGVEIIAKPPGKEPRSISQLSGGEKTLTAVALLMAIFRSKPSCFCVLDEVDAALDEGNVARFNNTIRQYTDHSRFIVITHNKRTMQSADRLYGVTMQERGVSKRVSVRFDQVKDDGSFNAKGAEPDARPQDADIAAPPLEPAARPTVSVAPLSRVPALGEVAAPASDPEPDERAAAPSDLLKPDAAPKPSRRLREALAQMTKTVPVQVASPN